VREAAREAAELAKAKGAAVRILEIVTEMEDNEIQQDIKKKQLSKQQKSIIKAGVERKLRGIEQEWRIDQMAYREGVYTEERLQTIEREKESRKTIIIEEGEDEKRTLEDIGHEYFSNQVDEIEAEVKSKLRGIEEEWQRDLKVGVYTTEELQTIKKGNQDSIIIIREEEKSDKERIIEMNREWYMLRVELHILEDNLKDLESELIN